ncbi:MAG TPA: ATP-grasp domain-containing protein [Pyrinomonadaceae bacterium]|jgi:biotin carboxylase
MTEATPSRPQSFVCLASYFKGTEFLRECKRQGRRVVLVTKQKTLGEDWPRECLDDLVALPDDAGPELYLQAADHLARHQKIDRIVALEEFDVINAALIREHLCLPGMTSTTARLFRDKLSMRVAASRAAIAVPDFVHLLNYEELHDYMSRVPPPWMLKPRSDVSAMGIRKLESAEQVWRAIDALDAREKARERSPYYLLESYVAGDVYHVDSLVNDARVVFAGANAYGRPPMDVAHGGGVFISKTLRHGSEDQKRLIRLNRKLIKSLGLSHGAAHAEFIKSAADGEFYFLEIAARVGGAYIAETLEAASGINLWREWARLEMAQGVERYRAPKPRREYGGIVLSLARQEYPDTSAYTDPEIVYRVRKRHHVGLVVSSPKPARIEELLGQYARRFNTDFTAVAPPLERAE